MTADRGDSLLLSYLGSNESKARELGLDVEERFVATGVIPKREIENLREVDTVVWPEGDINGKCQMITIGETVDSR